MVSKVTVATTLERCILWRRGKWGNGTHKGNPVSHRIQSSNFNLKIFTTSHIFYIQKHGTGIPK
jgi:hypothetical protein